MKKTKLSLKTLKVKSFITAVDETRHILGRGWDGSCNDDESDGGYRCVWPTEACFTNNEKCTMNCKTIEVDCK